MTEMRPIPGFEGYYSITEDGRVWSHDREHYQNGKRKTIVWGRWLKISYNNNVKCAQLRVNGKTTNITIRKAIFDAFEPNYGKRPVVEVMK